jgi:hypothetical protein
MGNDEAVVTQKMGKAPSPPKDHPALSPYLDWSNMQAYYGPGILPPTFFSPGIAAGHTPPPFILGPQVFDFTLHVSGVILIFKSSKLFPCASTASGAIRFWEAICRNLSSWWSFFTSVHAPSKHFILFTYLFFRTLHLTKHGRHHGFESTITLWN